ncbi:hypothetical protein DM01DRAFT_1378903 [Hesseltinella vesiculosa]|uniref:Extracellular membrane protein CFEM domain-containing protein n=1 Tax=Hesseltinella vesiculosa TaxID=101127 RepID=A0A1X2G3S7_9FUNG|nr:hypothetical protein DM01DRAFT_1378903 [Hesseltinella vesiculosa]
MKSPLYQLLGLMMIAGIWAQGEASPSVSAVASGASSAGEALSAVATASSLTPSASASSTPVPMPDPLPPTGTSPTCSDQVVFDQCLRNQDNYVKRCVSDDYACLCRWQQSKVSCYDNCPLDVGKELEVGKATHYCSQPGANITTAVPSWALPTSISASASIASPSATANPKSSASVMYEVPPFFSTLAIVLLLVHWM